MYFQAELKFNEFNYCLFLLLYLFIILIQLYKLNQSIIYFLHVFKTRKLQFLKKIFQDQQQSKTLIPLILHLLNVWRGVREMTTYLCLGVKITLLKFGIFAG